MSSELDVLLTETIARHFPEARLVGNEIDLGFAGLSMVCRVNSVGEVGSAAMANLFFNLRGGSLGSAPLFASVSGYGESDEEAIVTGACGWACAFGPVLRAALAGQTHASVASFEVAMDGQRYLLFVDGLDRALFFGAGNDHVSDRPRVARARLGAWPWLARVVVDSGRLPLLRPDRPTILSVFVASRPDGPIVEVKVNGTDWPGMQEAFANASNEPEGAITLLRELAVLVPVGEPASIVRSTVSRTLEGLEREIDGERRPAVQWPGWRQHGGALAAPLPADVVADTEATVGRLPPDYRRFLTEIAAAGAGPGYGLLPPTGEAQRRLAQGTFSPIDGASPAGGPNNVLALAHAGCGIMWFLVLGGAHRGEVWCDSRSSDGKMRRAAASFIEWYRDWLGAAVDQREPWSAWDARYCATASVLSQLLEQLAKNDPAGAPAAARLAGTVAPGKLALASGGGRCFAEGAPLDPCEACVAAAAHLGLDDDVFAPGVPPLEGHADQTLPPRSHDGRLARWVRRLKGG